LDSVRDAWSQRAMRPATIVVTRPLTKGSPQVRCIEWDDIVQTFATYASKTYASKTYASKTYASKTYDSNQSFAMSVGGGHTNR
jgi:hypothetical protein